jgi:Ca2+-binding RTX toxin-like protein
MREGLAPYNLKFDSGRSRPDVAADRIGGPVSMIVINQNYVIAAGQTLNFTNASGDIFQLAGSYGAPDPTFTNHGKVTISADTNYGVYAVYDTGATLRPTGYFHNALGASLIVSNSGGDASGFEAGGWSSDVFNDGLIEVSAPAQYAVAMGVRSHGPSGFEFKNTGTLEISGYLAWGVIMSGAVFINSGLIQVSGGANGGQFEAYGVALTATTSFTNSGKIVATSADAGHSVGVYFDYASGNQSITNSGLISGAYSVFSSYGVGNVTIHNTGTLSGDVDLSASSGVDNIQNAGHITGNVHLNQQNATGATYNGANGSVTGTVFGTSGADTLAGGAGKDVFEGGGGNDVINGGGGVNTAIFTGAYAAHTIGHSGAAVTVADATGTATLTNIQILEFSDRQMVLGSAGETLTARAGGDTLVGGPGADHLIGGAGNDTLIGGAGKDTLTGGGGHDTFVFTALSNTTVAAPDVITDFVSGQDRIDLSAIDANTAVAGIQLFHLGATAGHAGDITLHYDATDNRTVVSLFVNADATPDAVIWLAGNHTSMTAADFIL